MTTIAANIEKIKEVTTWKIDNKADLYGSYEVNKIPFVELQCDWARWILN